MRIYKVKNLGHTVQFARSFDHAKKVVLENDPKARKVSSADYTEYSNGFEIHAVDITTDKDGILTILNSLVPLKLIEEKTTEQVVRETALSGALFPEPKTIEINEEVIELSDKFVTIDLKEVGHPVIPATAYDGTGLGTCLHCNKKVGYVGGFPKVNPPETIRDK